MARLCATPGSFPHVDAASSWARSSFPPWWSGEAGSSWGLPPPKRSEGWTQAQGDASHSGSLADAAQPPYRGSWHLDVPLGGPDGDFGLSQPVTDGTVAIAVGPTQIVAADLGSGAQRWTVDRDYGPPVSPAIAATPSRRILIYTEGFGDSPPGSSATPSASASSAGPLAVAIRRWFVRFPCRGDRSGYAQARVGRAGPAARGQSNRRHGRRRHGVPRRQRRPRLRRRGRDRRDPMDGGCGRVPDDASGGLERPRDRGRSR